MKLAQRRLLSTLHTGVCRSRKHAVRRSNQIRPIVERLEDRCLLAAFTVNSLADEVDAILGDGVCETGTGNGVCSLRAAIQEANALAGYDSVQVSAGNYMLSITGPGENAAATGDLDITEGVTIDGAGAATTILDAAAIDRFFDIFDAQSVNISNLTIRNGKPTEMDDPTSLEDGGAIRVRTAANTSLTLTDVTLTQNTADNGGAVGDFGTGTLTITRGNVTENNAEGRFGGPGVMKNRSGDVNLSGSTITGNVATHPGGDGGGVYFNGDTLTITDTEISNNRLEGNSDDNGAGIYVSFASVVNITGSMITGNTASGGVGGVAFQCCVGGPEVTIRDSEISDNQGGFIGGIGLQQRDAQLSIFGSTIARNSARNGAGAIYSRSTGTITIENSSILRNHTDDEAGGVSHGGPLHIRNSTFNENSTTDSGGAIVSYDSELIISDSTFTGNSAGSSGGAIWTYSTTSLTNVVIMGNRATALGGGGIFNADPSTPVRLHSVQLADNSPGGNCGTTPGADSPFVDLGGSTDRDGTCGIAPAVLGVQLTSSADHSMFGQPVTFTAHISGGGSGSGTPTGTITFKDGITTLGTRTLDGAATATFATFSLPIGEHAITAEYSGDRSFGAASSDPLPLAVGHGGTTILITSTPNPSAPGVPVTFTAVVSASSPARGTPTGSVTFMEGGTILGTSTLSGGRAVLELPALGVGQHTVQASYSGDSQFTESISAELEQKVTGAFAWFPDQAIDDTGTGLIHLNVVPADFRSRRASGLLSSSGNATRAVLMTFEARASDGSLLDPGALTLRSVRGDSTPLVAGASDAASDPMSFALARVRRGQLDVVVSPDANRTGNYDLEVFLAGDTNADYRVDRRDLAAIRSALGKRAGDAEYALQADLNRDGIITRLDYRFARMNRNVVTQVRPLIPTIQLSSESDPNHDQIVTDPQIDVVGRVSPGAHVQLDVGADGSVDQLSEGDRSGAYQFSTIVPPGESMIEISSSDRFGQRARTMVHVAQTNDPSHPVRAATQIAEGQFASLPGSQHPLSWDIRGDLEDLEVLVEAQAPGNVFALDGSYQVSPGSRPATGRLYYLAPDNTWVDFESVYAAGQPTGSLSVALPTSDQGDWTLQIVLRDRTTGQIVSLQSHNILVSDMPAIHLTLNRTLANSSDTIRAELVTAAGQSPQPVQIVAALSLPDGSEISLPDFGSRPEFLYQGQSRDAQYVLLQQPLSMFGVGSYHLRVLMLDGSGQRFLALAGANITISDTAGTLTGIVRDGHGQPIDGSSTLFSGVQAFDADDVAVTAQASIGPDGRYNLTLDPGRYFISASVLDADGNVHRTQTNDVTVIGVNGANVQLDLVAGSTAGAVRSASSAIAAALSDTPPNGTVARAVPRAATPTPAPPPAQDCGGVPLRRVVIYNEFEGVETTEAANALAAFQAELAAASSCLSFRTNSDRAAAVGGFAYAQQIGNEDLQTSTHNSVDAAFSGDFLIVLSAKTVRTPAPNPTTRLVVSARLVDSKTAIVKVAGNEVSTDTSSASLLTLIRKMARAMRPGLPQSPTENRALPALPVLSVTLDRVVVTGLNAVIRATVTVTEKTGDGTRQSSVSGINLIVTPPQDTPQGGTPQANPPLSLNPTNAAGQTSTTFLPNVPGSPIHYGDGKVQAILFREGQRYQSPVISFKVSNNGSLTLSTTQLNLIAEQCVPVNLRFLDLNGSPVIGAAVGVAADEGGDLAPSCGSPDEDRVRGVTVTTNGQGQNNSPIVFIAGDRAATVRVGARAESTASTGGGEAVTDFLTFTIKGAVVLNENVRPRSGAPSNPAPGQAPVVHNGTDASVTADVQVGGSRVPNLPVQFTLTGPGQLTTRNSQTDEFGQAETLYVPPASGSGTASITVTTRVDGAMITQSLSVQHNPIPATVTISPANSTVGFNRTQQFTASVSGPPDHSVTWSATGGSISNTGLFTAGSTQGSFTVTARSVADPSASAQTNVFVVAPFAGDFRKDYPPSQGHVNFREFGISTLEVLPSGEQRIRISYFLFTDSVLPFTKPFDYLEGSTDGNDFTAQSIPTYFCQSNTSNLYADNPGRDDCRQFPATGATMRGTLSQDGNTLTVFVEAPYDNAAVNATRTS